MDGSRLRRACAFALIVMVSAGVVGAAGASAAPPGAHPDSGHRVAAGTYTATFASLGASALVITAATDSTIHGTFALSAFGDFGTWVTSGTTVAFLVSNSNSGHSGAVLLGKLTTSGIAPGAYGLAGVGEQAWTATRTATRGVVNQAAHPDGAVKVAGVYTAQFPTAGFSDTLTITVDAVSKRDGTFAFTNLADSGNWVVMGKHIALGVTTGADAGITLVGAVTPTGIATAAKPGAYDQPGNGVYPWYATR